MESPLCPTWKGELHTQQPRGKSVPWVSKTILTPSSSTGLVGLVWSGVVLFEHQIDNSKKYQMHAMLFPLLYLRSLSILREVARDGS